MTRPQLLNILFDKKFHILFFVGIDCREESTELPFCSEDVETTESGSSGGSSILNLRTAGGQVPG